MIRAFGGGATQKGSVLSKTKCNNCGSRETEDLDGQITCAKCGLVLEARQVVLEEQEVREGDIVNLRRARKIQTTKKSGNTGETADDHEDQVQYTREQSLTVFHRVIQGLQSIGFSNIDVESALAALEEFFPQDGRAHSYTRILTYVYTIVYIYLGETTITLWDMTHMAAAGIVPCFEFEGMEKGPKLHNLIEVYYTIHSSKPRNEPTFDEKAVALRCSILLARTLKIAPHTLWRAAWLVLFGLGGLKAREKPDIISIAAGVVASVVLLKGWKEKAMALKLGAAYSFSPVGVYLAGSMGPNRWMEEMESNPIERRRHYQRQNLLISTFPKDTRRTLDDDLEQFFSDKCGEGQAVSQQQQQLAESELPFLCDGHCLEDFYRASYKSARSILSLKEIDVWAERVDVLYPDAAMQAMHHLRHFTSRALDRVVKKRDDTNDWDRTYTEIRKIAGEASKLKVHEKIDQFYADTLRLSEMGCRKLFCCARVGKQPSEESQQQRKKSKKRYHPFEQESRRCGKCENCLNDKDCRNCVACLAKQHPSLIASTNEADLVCSKRKCKHPKPLKEVKESLAKNKRMKKVDSSDNEEIIEGGSPVGSDSITENENDIEKDETSNASSDSEKEEASIDSSGSSNIDGKKDEESDSSSSEDEEEEAESDDLSSRGY